MKNFNRNLKSLNNKTGQKIKNQINIIIDNANQYKSCYFWTNTGNAADRRRQEFDVNFNFIFNGKKYEIAQSLAISCKNFYFKNSVAIDGKKSNITPLKNLLKG